MRVAIILAFGLLMALTSVAQASFDDHNRLSARKWSGPLSSDTQEPAALVPGIYQQKIDHFGQLPGQTFGQRYWVDSEFATQGASAPVLYHICGEGDAEQGYFLHDSAIEWAQTLGARLVYLEHRYYGKSLPFPDLSSEHLQYLTLDNVIEDLASFQKWLSASQGWTGKWITVGGSYSGTISAIYRLAHPELDAGALASSAPMISGVGQIEGTQDDVDSFSSTDPSDDTGDRQWVYQSCTKFGFWETDGSSLYDPSPWLCQQLFGNVALADSTVYNQKYYAPFISNSATAPSRILFTYGTQDIWTTIGLPPQDNANSKITIQLIEGAGHHFDLNGPDPSDSAAVNDARATFIKMARGWLGQ